MSRSNNTEVFSPVTRSFEWNGDAGGFRYYDKTENKKIEVPYPFRFLVLDKLATIKGFSDADQSGYWSNDVRDIKKETFTVRTKKGIEFIGTYEQVKEKLGGKGADFAQKVFIAYYNDEKKLVIGDIILKGAAIGPWFEFCKTNKVMEIGIQVKGHVEGKKGKTVYQIPVYEVLNVTDETNNAAIALDKELQEYLKAYFNRHLENSSPEIEPEKTPVADNNQQESRQSNTTPPAKVEKVEDAFGASNDFEDLPF